MRRLWAIAWIGLLGTLTVWGQEERVATFRTSPARVQVYQLFSTGEKFLGTTDQALLVTVPERGNVDIVMRFDQDGFESVTRRLQRFSFDSQAVWPPLSEPPVTLPPHSLWAKIQVYRGWVLVGSLVAGLAGAFLMFSHRSRRQAQARAALLEAYRARGQERPGSLTMAVLGGYRILDKIGSGGMSTVYRAVPEDSLDESAEVAVKIIHPELAGNHLARRFRREIAVSSRLSHPNIIRVIEWGEHEENLFLVLELLEGETMRQQIPPEGLAPARIRALCGPVFQALDYAHGQGVLHRDIKPDNVFVTSKGLVKLMDFGLARNQDMSIMTAVGTVLGTPSYMAPEQFDGEHEPGSDQYALGAITFELLTGVPPFQAGDPFALAFLHASKNPPRPSSIRADVPEQVEAVVLRMLKKVPQQRFETVGEAWKALDAALTAWVRQESR